LTARLPHQEIEKRIIPLGLIETRQSRWAIGIDNENARATIAGVGELVMRP